MTTTAPRQQRRQLLKKQMAFVRARERFVMYSGCFAGGKSVAICAKAVSRAAKPGTREGLCRKTLVSLKSSTLRTLLDGDGPNMPPLLPPGSYTHNKAEKIIRIKNGGEIVYFGLDDPSKIGSYNLTGCGVDEAVDITKADWIMLQGRIRSQVEGVPNQIYGATNPGPPSHWIAQDFGLAADTVAKPSHLCIPTKITDNHFLDPAYVESMASLEGVAYKRYYLGEWAGAEGLVFDQWRRDRNMRSRDTDWTRSILCCDDGYTDPFTCLSLRKDSMGRLHVDREVYERGLTEPEKVDRVRSMIDTHDLVVVDAAAPGLIETMNRAGLPTIASTKGPDSIFRGIMQIQSGLGGETDGVPNLTIAERCTNLINEVESYEWRKTKDGQSTDKPIDAFNHTIDALRYGITEMIGGAGDFRLATEDDFRIASQSEWDMDEW